MSAQLKGALHGLSLAWNLGYRKVWLEMDLVVAMELIEHRCLPTHSEYSLVEEIIELLTKGVAFEVLPCSKGLKLVS